MQALHLRLLLAVAVMASMASVSRADETLVLSLSFVHQAMNTAAIDLKQQFEIDAHLTTPHPISSGGNDGDIHMAGRSNDVQLPLVAEIVNARLESAAETSLNQTAAGQKVDMSGVWRIWFEHLGTADQIQGNPVEVPSNSNPAHVFEIHPITKFNGIDIALSTFVPITSKAGSSYQAYPANVAFKFYENDPATIQSSDTALQITSGEGKYNYAEFVIELAGSVACTDSSGNPVTGDSGAACANEPNTQSLFVLANIFDTSDPEHAVTADVRRMVFVKGTQPADQVASLSAGGRLHVLGIPRVNLAEAAAVAILESAGHQPALRDDCRGGFAVTVMRIKMSAATACSFTNSGCLPCSQGS